MEISHGGKVREESGARILLISTEMNRHQEYFPSEFFFSVFALMDLLVLVNSDFSFLCTWLF